MIKTIFFDIGGVLIDIHPEKTYQYISDCVDLSPDIIKKKFPWEAHNEYEKGHISDRDWFMATSSSYKSEEVVAWRHQKFRDWLEKGEFIANIPSFNLLQEKDMEAWSPYVAREDHHTKSLTQILLSGLELKLTYYDESQIDDLEKPISKILKIKG